MTQSHNFFVTGHKGFETALFHEVREILSKANDPDIQIKKVYGGIELRGTVELAYRVCIFSRLANRVYLPLKTFKAENEEILYQQVYDIDWSKHLTSRHSFSVAATLSRSDIHHSHYASLKVKDAVVDYFRNTVNSRPIIEKERPDVRIHLIIHKNTATLSLDLSGQSLHRRGYRLQHSGAPLKENLAAALLMQSGWSREASSTHSLIDPMCGSGTFAIEAAMMAANIPPGLDRDYFGFLRWLGHDKALWESCLEQAEQGIDPAPDCEILASDIDSRALEIARDNAMRAGVDDLIQFTQRDINELTPQGIKKTPIIIINPPYGERLQAEQGLATLYSQMGKVFKGFAESGTQASLNIISANPDLLHRLRLNRSYKKSVNNGQLSCVFASFDIQQSPSQPDQTTETAVRSVTETIAIDAQDQEANALLNRLKKNDKHLSKWAKRNQVSCYRVYDADLPEFSFALDCYRSSLQLDRVWYHLQEYQAPKTIEAEKAAHRIQLAQQVIKNYFNIDERQLFSKLRQRQRGKQQYEKQGRQGDLLQVTEGAAQLLVNLEDYLDTGLFLDHRTTRQRIFEQVQGKSFLNLFCYTASVSVQAALGGASEVVSADMSATYINWAKENFELNNLVDDKKYQFLQWDCIELLRQPKRYGISRKFDLIFLDPPSFSNSKKMKEILDIERDHVKLIQQSMDLLEKDGMLIFSTNKKGFRLNAEVSRRYQVKDITAQTIPEDFKRRPKIHQCWEIGF